MSEKRTKDPVTKKKVPLKEPKPMSEAAKKGIALREKKKADLAWIKQQQRIK
tara:strand:+ start:9251 stop:9406 length:156 start_codon:yes stop_codon:yes gene_type:complete